MRQLLRICVVVLAFDAEPGISSEGLNVPRPGLRSLVSRVALAEKLLQAIWAALHLQM